MPAFWKLNWLRNLVHGKNNSTLPLLNKHRRRDLRVETLEERLTPASLRYDATDASPLTLWVNSGRFQVVNTDDLSVLADYALGDVTDFTIDGNTFNVTLTLDSTVTALPGGITFEGGSGVNTLLGPITDTTWNVTGPDEGYLNSPGYFSFDGVENLIGADNNEDTFIFTAGASISGTVDGGAGGTDTIIDGSAATTVGFEVSLTDPGPDVTITGADVVIDLTRFASVNVVRTNPDKVRVFRPSPGMITVESEDGAFTSQTFADPTNSLTIKTGFNAKGTDEHIYVEDLGTFSADLILDTGSTNKNNDGPDKIELRGNINLVGHKLDAKAETIDIQSGVIISTSNPTQAGEITLTGWDITLDTNAQLLAEGATKATSGAITIDAVDENAYFTPVINVDISDVSITVKTGAIIRGGDVTMQAVADNTHILSLNEFTDTDTVPKLGLLMTDIVAQAIEGLTQIGAGIVYSEATAKIDVQTGTQIDAQTLVARSTANASAITAPIVFVVGIALGVIVTDAQTIMAGTVTTTQNATVQASVDHSVNVFSDVGPMVGGTAAVAVSVIKSNATAQITDDADFTVGGDLNVLSSTIDRNRTGARSVAGENGVVGIAISVGVEVGDTNAYLDGVADVAGSVIVGATQQKLPVANSKLFVLPNWANGIAAQAGVGENSTGDLLDDTKAQAINAVKTKILAKVAQLRGKVDDKVPESKDNTPSVEVAASVAVSIDTNNVNARIGDGNADNDNKNGDVEADGGVSVQAIITNRPDITASSSTTFNAGASLPGGSSEQEGNKFQGSFAVGVGVYNNNAKATINSGAAVDAGGTLLVSAQTLNDYAFSYGVNLIQPLLETPAFKSSDGVQTINNGDIIEVAADQSDLGHVGNWYRYNGVTRNIDLGRENYLNTGSWIDLGGKVGKNAKDFIGNLTNYLNGDLGLDNNAVDSWSQAVAGGDTDVAVAGSFMYVELNHVAEALIKDGADVNQDTAANFRTGNQNVIVEATSANDMVNFGGNIKLLGIAGSVTEWKISPQTPGGGTSTNDGKGAVGFTFQFYNYDNTVTAKIEDGVQLYGDSLEVDAESRGMSIVVGASGGKSNGVAFNGAFAVNLIENHTLAQIENGAQISIGTGAVADADANGAAVFVDATDTTYAIIIVGGVAISDHVGIGATVGINIINRDTEAVIGNKADDASLDTRQSFTAGGDVKLNAKNDGFVGAFAVSGSATSSNSDTAPQGQTGMRQTGGGSTDDPGKLPNNQSNYDSVIKELKMKFGETDSQASDPNSAGNNKGKAGISISGAVSLSIVDDNARAYVRNTGAFTVNSGQVFISANNNTSIGSLAGAVALALGGGSGNNLQLGIAGAVGIDLMSGTTDAFIDGPTSITADGLTLGATRTGYIVSLTAGVSGAVGRQGIAIGGSVAVMRTVNTTETALRNTTGTINGPITAHASDDSTIILIAGSGGFGGQAGVGAAVAFSEIQNTVRSEIENVEGDPLLLINDFKHTGAIDLQATADGLIVAIAGSAGVGTQGSSGGGAGTIAINFIDNTVEAQILNTTTTSDSTGDITLRAEDDSLIVSIAGAVGAGQTGAVGAALGFNFISNDLKAIIENSSLTTDGAVGLTADSDATIGGVAIGVAIGTGSGFALEGSVEVNTIVNTIDAHIKNSTVNADGAVTARAVDQSLLISIAGGVAASVSGSAGVGAAITYNRISNGVAAYIDNSTVDSNNSFIALSASSTPLMVAIAAAGGGGQSVGGAGTLTINSIANTIDAHITGSDIEALDDVSVTANESATMVVIALAGAGAASGGAIGASIAYNYVGGPEPGDPNVLSYNDGVVDGTKNVTVAGSEGAPTSSVQAFIDGSSVSAGGDVIVSAGFADPTAAADPGPIAAETITINPTTQVSTTTSTITFAAPHGYKTGDEVVYYKGVAGNTALGGLVDGKVYFVIKVNDNTIKLADTQTDAVEEISIDISSQGTGAGHSIRALDASGRQPFNPKSSNTSNNQIKFVDDDNTDFNHGFTTGEPVVYHKGSVDNTAIGGLVDGQVYYVINDGHNKIRLALDATSAGLGLGLPLFSAGSGEGHSFTPLAAGKTFTPATGVVVHNAQQDIITFSAPHGLETGDALFYRPGSGTAIGGLRENETYYVIKIDATRIRLAATHQDATHEDDDGNPAPRHVFLTSLGTGTAHSLIVKPRSASVNGITAALPIGIGGQITSVTAAGAGGQGLGGAGAVSLNFVRMDVLARISATTGGDQISAGGDVTVQAKDTSHINSGAGSLGIATGSGVAVNASVGVNDIRNNVEATIVGATVQAPSGDVTVSAEERARIINVVIGGAVAAGGGASFGGSFAVNFIKNNVDASIRADATTGASDVDADGDISVTARDTASIATLAGNVNISIGGGGAVGVAFAVNEVNDSVKATIDGSTANAATGDIIVDATFAKPTDLPAGLDVQIAAMAVAGGGASDIAGAGSVALNWVRNTVEAKIANIPNVGAGDEISAAGELSVTASDNSTINSLAGAIAIAGIGASAASGAIGASVAYNYLGGDPNDPNTTDNNVVRAAIENVTGTIRASSVDVHASYVGAINNITVAGSGAGTFALGGAVSINFIRNTADAHISGVTSLTTTGTGAQNVRVRAEDDASIWVLAGGVGIAIATTTPVGLAAGVSVAVNEITNTIKAYVDNSLVTAGGSVEISAESESDIQAITIGVAIAVSAGTGGFSGSGAGAGSGNTIENTIHAYISNSQSAASKGVFATGSLVISAIDNPSIIAGAGALAFAGSFGGGGGAGASIGASVTENTIDNSVKAYVDNATARATGGNLELTASETATIDAYSVAGSVALSGGSLVGLSGAGAGGHAKNFVTNTVEAYANSAALTTLTSGNVNITATDSADVNAINVAGAVAIAASGVVSGAIAIGASIANNDIENTVRAYSQASTISSADSILVSAGSTAIVNAVSVAVSIAAAVSPASLALSGAGAESTNTVNNTIAAFIQGTSAAVRSTTTAADNITVSATESATITSKIVAIAGSGGIAGGSVGVSVADNTVTSSITAYAQNANLTATNNNISITASATDTVSTLSIATAIAIAIGGAGAGGEASADVSPTIEAYTGAATTLSAGDNITITATSNNSVDAESAGAAGGLVAIGTSITDAKANGSVKAHIDGVVTGSDNLTVTATATNTADSLAIALAGGIVSGAGARADSTVSPTVEAYTGNANITARQAMSITATATPHAISKAVGVAVSAGVSVGAALAYSTVSPSVSAYVGGASSTISAASLSIVANQLLPGGSDETAEAHAIGASGGVLAGISGSEAKAFNGTAADQATYRAYVVDGTTLTITNSTAVSVNSNSKQNALADNYNLGLLAAGAGGSYANSNTVNEAYLGNNVSLTGRSLSISATGIDDNFAEVRAGSGGAVAGAGAKADTDTVSSTKAQIRAGNGVKKIDLTGVGTGTLQIAADHTAKPNARVVVAAGGLLAGTGAETFHTIDSTVEASIGANAIVWAKNINMSATNHVIKPALPDYENALDSNKTGPNILGATGGLVSAAGAVSETTITFDTQVKIGAGASVEVKGNAAAPGAFVLAALNDIQASDKVTLGTGGALSGAGGYSTIKTDGDLAKVDIGDDADLKSIGGITMSARGQGTVFAGVAVDTFGVGTVGIAETLADIRPVNEIHVGDDATIHADGDLKISTGRDTDFNRDQYTIEARTDTFAGSLIPIDSVAATATLIQTNTITIDDGALLETARNAYLHAEKDGFANMTGYAKATSWVSAIGDAINGQSFDDGEVNTLALAKVQMDGTVRTGIAREKTLVLDSWNSHPVSGPPTVSASTNVGNVGYTVTQEPLQSSLLQELENAQHQLDVFSDSGNTTLINFYTAEVNRLTALLQEQGLLDQPTSPNGTPPPQPNTVFVTTVTLDDIWAQAGIIDVRTDVLLGDGLFDSPGDAKVIIHNSTPAFLRIKRITIPQTNGGVFFNGNPVSSATVDDFNVFESGLPVMLPSFQPFALPGTGIPPVVEIKNTFNPLTYSDPNFPDDVYPPPDISIIGSFEDQILRGIDNLSGNVSLVIEGGKGNININAPVRAKNLSVITGGDVNISGVTDFSIGGEALSHWKTVSDLTQAGNAANSLTVLAAIAAINALPLGANSSVQIATVNQGVQPASNVINGVPTGIRHAQAVSLPYATGGTFTLTFAGQTTAAIPYNVDAPTLQTLLNNLPTTVDFAVSGDGSRGNPFIVQVTNTFDNYAQMTANTASLIGNVSLYGDRITIDAEYLNVNGIMQSGKPDYILNIGAATAAEITTIKNAGVPGLHVLKTASNPDFVVRYDYGQDRIQVEEIQVSGGYIEIHGHVLNTGKGEIRLLGGFGNITINNTTSYDVVIKRLDASQSGAGKLIIQDDAKGPAYITLYEKAGNTVTRTIDDGSGPQVATVGDDSTYTPQSGYRYGWSISQEQYTRKYKTTGSSTWLGIDDLAADPATIEWDSIEQIGQPVLVGEGPYYYTGSGGDYTFAHNVVNIVAPVYYTINEHTETSWCGKKTYYATLVEETKNADIYTHTIRADRDINIKFLGYSEATVSVTSSAGILLDGPILNTSGVTTLTAAQEIEKLRDGATVGGRRVVMSAGTGIGAGPLGALETNVGDTAPSDFSSTEILVGVGAGDRVKLAAGYANGGTPGAIYRYLGQTAVNLNLGTENYADTSKWQLATGSAFKYTSDANKTRIVPGNQVLVVDGHTAGGVVGAVYRYTGTTPALVDLSNESFANGALWQSVQFFSSFKATSASGVVQISQLTGDLPIDLVSAGPGADINLTAGGDIRVAQLGTSTWALGRIGNTTAAGTVNLTSTSGGIGAAGRLIEIYSGTLNKDTVSLTAQNSIYVREGTFSAAVKASNPEAGNLRLKKAISASPTGIIHIEVPDGALIDANNSQVVDQRTTEQLATGIWRDLGLTNETPVLPGDTVQLQPGYTGGGTPGAVYRYIGDPASLLLGEQDYTNGALWELTTDTFGKYSTEPGATAKVNDTIDSFIGQKNAEYKSYWNFRTQQAHDDAIGLSDDSVYYVVVDPTNPNRILLAQTHADALAGTNLIDITPSPTLGADHNFQFVPPANLDAEGPVTGTGPLLGFDSQSDVFGADDAILLGAHGLVTGDAVLYTRTFNFTFDSSYHVRLSAAEEAFYRNELGFDDAAILTLENQRTAQYIDLHSRYGQFGDTYDPNFNYVPTPAEDAFLRGSIRVWTVEELLNTISAGLLKPTAGTQTQIEDPNIQGHDVTIIAAKGIGQTGGQITLDLVNRPKPLQLTREERIAFAAADRIDVSYLAGSPTTAFVTFADVAGGDTITRLDGGDWLADGLQAGMYIEVAANSPNATAKGVAYQIASVTSTVITLTADANLQNDPTKTATLTPVVLDPRTPTANIVGDFDDAGTVTRTLGDWIDDGFKVGMQIKVTGNSANATGAGAGQFYTIAAVTTKVLTLVAGDTLVDEDDVTVTVVGPQPTVTAIVIDQRDDVNINATGIINARGGVLDINGDIVPQDGANVYLGSGAPEGGSETSLILGEIRAGDEVRIKSRPGIFNGAAAGIVNIIGGDLILESGNNAVGTAAAPITIEPYTGATLTARGSLDVHVSQTNAGGTAGNMNVETVSSDTAGVYLRADGAIVDALGTDTPKIGAAHIDLTAGLGGSGGIGEANDTLEINLTPAGTLRAVAEDSIYLRETSGNMGIQLVQSSEGDAWLRAAGSINDANATGGVDIFANNITLTSDFGGIGISGNDLDIDSRFGGAQDGVFTSTSVLDANIIEVAGDLHLYEIRTDFPDIDANVYTAYIAAPTGSILNGNTTGGHNVLSGRTLLFARDDIGEESNHLTTAVGILQGTSTLGNTWVDNTGALDLDSIDGVSANSVFAGGSIYVNASSPVTVTQNMIAGDEIVVVAHDDGDNEPDHLIVKSGVSIASGEFVRLLAGDDLTIEVGATVIATDFIDLFGDFQGDIDGNPAPVGQANADPGEGSIITILGTLNAPEITIMGEADRDTILIDVTAQGSSITGHVTVLGGGSDDIVVITNLNARAQSMDVDGQEGADTYVVNIRGASTGNLINVFDSGTDGGASQVDEAFDATDVDGAADTVQVADGIFRTGQAIMYHGPGTPDGVLVEGRIYFAVVDPSDPTLIQLALTYADATAATPVVIDLSGVAGTGHSLSAIDNLTVYGTDVADTFLLRASKHEFVDGGSAFVAAVYGDPATTVERVSYNKNLENLVLDTKDGDDTIAIDDNWTTTTVFSGDGEDTFQVGQIFKSERDAANAGIAPDDEFETVVTTRGFLSNGVSYAANLNGGADADTFTVFRNVVPIELFGDDGDDNFIIRAFALEGSQTSTVAGSGGNDFVQYVLNAPVDVVGGTGHDTVRIIGTEFSDQFVITALEIFGAGVSVNYTEIETLEIDAAEGNDTLYVLSTDPSVVTILYGGLGSDTFNVGGDVPEIVDSGNNVLFPATPGNHTMAGIATSLLTLNGESSPGFVLTLVAPIMLPGETNSLPAQGPVVSYTGTGGPLATDTMTIDDDNLAAIGITNPLVTPITDPLTQLVGKTLEIAGGPGRGRFWLIEGAVAGPLPGQWTLTLKNVALPDDAWGLPDATSTFAITHASPAFFTDETLSVDYATIFNDAAPGQIGVLAPLDTEIIGGHLIVTSTMLTGLGMTTGIKSTQLESLDILLGDGDDEFTVRATAQNTATLVQANGGADLVNVGSTAADNDGNLDLIQGRLNVLGGDNPAGPPEDRIYINDYASTGRMNYLITPAMVVHFDLPDDWYPSPPIANYDPPRPTFAGMDYDGTTEFLHIVGNDEVNIFNVQPSLDTQFHVDGRLPPPSVPLPGGGDYLHLDTHTTGTTGRKLHITAVGTGHWGFTSAHQIVTFTSIERFNHVATYAVGSNGRTPFVRVYDAETNEFLYQRRVYEAFFRGGVRVITGDVNHDGIPDLIVAPGPGRAPTIKVYSGTPNAAGAYAAQLLTQFNVFPRSYKKGLNVALGDINNDGALDLVVGADQGWVPELRVIHGKHIVGSHKQLFKPFLVFPNNFRGGIRVAAGDINRDGFDDIVVGTGPGTVSTMRIFSGARLSIGSRKPLRTIKPFGATNKNGIFVSIGDFNGDGVRDVTASADRGWLPFVVTYHGTTVMGGPLQEVNRFMAFPNTVRTGVRNTSKPTDGGNPGFVEAIDLYLSTGAQGGVNSRRVRLAHHRPGLPPSVIDRLFAQNTFDGIYLG